MTRTTLLIAALLPAGLPAALPAGMITLDFEELSQPGSGFVSAGLLYEEDGFTISTDGAGLFAPRSGHDVFFAGSTALFSRGAQSTVELVQSDGNVFDLISIDLTERHTLVPSGTTSLTLTGHRADSSTVSQRFTLDGVFGLETFNVTGFTDLLSVEWAQTPSEFVQFDNLVLSTDLAAVAFANPEPSSLALLGVGALGLIGCVPRRRRQAKRPA